jgi:hypothetical protein
MIWNEKALKTANQNALWKPGGNLSAAADEGGSFKTFPERHLADALSLGNGEWRIARTIARWDYDSMQSIKANLTGEWVGYYTGHYDEFVRIVQKGDVIEAVKITGDDFVPADEITWRANVNTGYGEGQIAEREFRNPRFVPGKLKVLDEDRIVFSWMNCGEVEFRRDE